MNRLACTASLLMGFSAVWPVPASAQPYVPPGVARAPFTATLSTSRNASSYSNPIEIWR